MSRCSSTALVVAGGQLLMGSMPGWSELVNPVAKPFLRAALAAAPSPWPLVGAAVERPFARGAFRALADQFLPGLLAHQVLRKQLLRRWTRTAVAEGAEQVVVLGAGLDTLALELRDAFPAIRFIELDRPETLKLKRAALARVAGPAPNHALVDGDLGRGSIERQLRACALYDPTRPTVFVAEGVLMYLPPARVGRLLRELAARCGVATWIAFTFLEPDGQGHPAFKGQPGRLDAWLARRGEPFRWGEARGRIAVAVRRAGFAICKMTDDGWREGEEPRGFRGAPVSAARGEYLCLAVRGRDVRQAPAEGAPLPVARAAAAVSGGR